ncbi:hypothetical protein HAX54_009468, partial [Datura stramonium]|nr:hypothetical protein [Datura stramonium]
VTFPLQRTCYSGCSVAAVVLAFTFQIRHGEIPTVTMVSLQQKSLCCSGPPN